MYFELARLRPSAGGRWLFLVNIEWRRRRPFLERGNRIRIAQIPDVFLWIIRRSKGAACLRPSHDPDYINDAVGCTLGTCDRVLAIVRHKAAIDENDAASGESGRGEHPVAWTLDVGTQRRSG